MAQVTLVSQIESPVLAITPSKLQSARVFDIVFESFFRRACDGKGILDCVLS